MTRTIRIALLLALAAGVLGAALPGTALAQGLDAPGAAKAMVCGACHGTAGQSPGDTVPILAGMAPAYFKKAIEDYAAGRRPSPEMGPFAKATKELGLDEIAAFFAAQKKGPPAKRPAADAVARGKTASPVCAACHGPAGGGDLARGAPAIAGQPAGYLRAQLQLFQADKRSPGDQALAAVKAALKGLKDAELADLAAYYSSLP